MRSHSTSTPARNQQIRQGNSPGPDPNDAQTHQADEVVLQDASSERSFFTILPNIVLKLGLSPYALTLYIHFKKVTGEEERGVCFKNSATLVSESGLSAGSISKAKRELERPRAELDGKALITIEERKKRGGGKPQHHIRLTDIWAVNIAAFAKPEAISPNEGTISSGEIARSRGEIAISPREIKKNPPEEKQAKQNPHTQNHLRAVGAPAVVVGDGSKFSIEDCRRYADHLHASGQGVNNPGGFARTIHKTGAEDSQIAAWLAEVDPERVRSGELPAPALIDASACPDCHGTRFYYPAGFGKPVVKCKHERLAGAA
jgi:hypothetical protein